MTEPLRDLVLDIYDTIANPAGWPKVLDRLAEKVNARGIILFELFEKGGERRLGALGDIFDQSAHMLVLLGDEAIPGFLEDQQFGFSNDRLGHADTLALAA